jgi:ribosomal protein S18 acetylase RimI-like enzyme
MQLTLRPALPSDRPFVERVYFETQRWIIERLFGWRGDETERQKFANFYNETSAQIIRLDGDDAGWITVITDDAGVEISQIYVLPEFQNKGVGTRIISDIIAKARSSSLCVRISTAKINPAIRLYERLGFRQYAETEFKIFLELR